MYTANRYKKNSLLTKEGKNLTEDPMVECSVTIKSGLRSTIYYVVGKKEGQSVHVHMHPGQ